jgi:membrane-bound inhibitor of C-type lysozyme
MNIAWRSLAVASLAISALVSAATADAAGAKPIKAKYLCSKGQSLKVVFQGSRAIVTPKGGKTITLRQAMAADGFRYSKGKYSLRGRGDDATWTTGRGKPLGCHARG